MPWIYTNTRNVSAPVLTTVPTSQARIRTVTINIPTSVNEGEVTIDVDIIGGSVTAGVFTAYEHNYGLRFTGAEAKSILSGGLASALETSILTALKTAGKLPPGSVA